MGLLSGIVNLKAYLIVAAGVFVVAGVLSAGATARFFEKVVIPLREKRVEVRVKRVVGEQIALAVKMAAEKAKAVEAVRQRKIAAESLRQFQLEQEDIQKLARNRVTQLEKDNRKYVEKLKRAGIHRPLTGGDVIFLDRLHGDQGPR